MVHRTARVALRVSAAQRRRCLSQLRSAGDVWACVLELNELRRRRGDRWVVGYQELCRELTRAGPGCFGELSVTGARSVLRRYSDACFAAAKKRRLGDPRARSPRRRRALVPVRLYTGTFSIVGRRLTLPTAKGAPPLVVRLARDLPYRDDEVRCVTLLLDAGRLVVDVTAEVQVHDHDLDPERMAGVDPGIIHPFAVAGPDDALIVSGRGIRAESRLHLADTKARQRAQSRRVPRRGQRGSRRWRRTRAAQRRAEARHRRRVRQAHHEAAAMVVAWAADRRIGTLVVGNPQGICDHDAGRRHNRALRTWRRTHLIGCLSDKAERAGMAVRLVDERGTSSTCPQCRRPVRKPKGRNFTCPHCGHHTHRDLAGARNIAAKGGGTTSADALVTHRRAGRNLPGRTRRDPRRVRMDARRGPWPATARPDTGESLVEPQA